MLVYIWSRRNPYVRMNFLGLFTFTAPYLPWVLLGFTILLNNIFPGGDLLGMAVAHVYYFFDDVYPRMEGSNGVRWLQTPRIVRWLVEGVILGRNLNGDEGGVLPQEWIDTPTDNNAAVVVEDDVVDVKKAGLDEKIDEKESSSSRPITDRETTGGVGSEGVRQRIVNDDDDQTE